MYFALQSLGYRTRSQPGFITTDLGAQEAHSHALDNILEDISSGDADKRAGAYEYLIDGIKNGTIDEEGLGRVNEALTNLRFGNQDVDAAYAALAETTNIYGSDEPALRALYMLGTAAGVDAGLIDADRLRVMDQNFEARALDPSVSLEQMWGGAFEELAFSVSTPMVCVITDGPGTGPGGGCGGGGGGLIGGVPGGALGLPGIPGGAHWRSNGPTGTGMGIPSSPVVPGRYSGRYADGQKAYRTNVPRDQNNNPIPDPNAGGPHSRLQRDARNPGRIYSATEFDASGQPVKRVDFAGRGETVPHEHPYNPATKGFGDKRPLRR